MNHSHLQTAAELHVRYRIAKQHNVCGKASNINNESARDLLQAGCLRYDRCISLRIDQHMPDHEADRCSVKDKVHCAALKILCKPLPQRIMLRGQSYGQIRFHHWAHSIALLQFLRNGKKGQDKISVIFRLVPHIRDAFAGQRPILAAIFQNVRINGWTDRIIGQSGGKHEIDGFDRRVAMINWK